MRKKKNRQTSSMVSTLCSSTWSRSSGVLVPAQCRVLVLQPVPLIVKNNERYGLKAITLVPARCRASSRSRRTRCSSFFRTCDAFGVFGTIF